MRYARLHQLDTDTEQVRAATAAVVGAGATGSRMLEQLARLGADIRVVDRDYLEESNLATSALYTAEQVEERLPKAVAAAEQLQAATPGTDIDPVVADLNHRTVNGHLAGVDIVLDGTDNMATRHLLNEYCVTHGVPWVHVAALAQRGEVMPVVPGETTCFNCVFEDVDGSRLATCETAGLSPPAAAMAASLGVAAAVDILAGETPQGLTRLDVGRGRFNELSVEQDACRVCGGEATPHLDGEAGPTAATVCGQNMYHVQPGTGSIDLDALGTELRALGDVTRNDHLLRFSGPEEFTVFADGRMIVEADSREAAKSIYSRFIGR